MSILTINEKLMAIQSGLKVPKSQTNVFGKYKYRSCEDILEHVKPILEAAECSLTLSDSIELVGTRFYVKATATMTSREGTISVSAYAREEEVKKGMDVAQITGAASSYARKYALNGLFCIDDMEDADTMDNTKAEPNSTPVVPIAKQKPTIYQVKKAMSQCKVPHEVETVLTSAKKYLWMDAEEMQLNEMYKDAINRTLPL